MESRVRWSTNRVFNGTTEVRRTPNQPEELKSRDTIREHYEEHVCNLEVTELNNALLFSVRCWVNETYSWIEEEML
jgi:hypothetical protein